MTDRLAGKDLPAIFIVSYGRPDLLSACLDSISRFAAGCAVFVFDNHSSYSREIRALATQFEDVVWEFSGRNIGFGAAVNRLAQKTECDFLLLNPDAVLTGEIDEFVEVSRASSSISCTAPGNSSDARYWDVAHRRSNTVRAIVSHAGYSERLRGSWVSELYQKIPKNDVGYLGGACLLIRREAWVRIGPFDERFFLYSEEVDWQLRGHTFGMRPLFYDSILFEHSAQGTVVDSPAGLSASAALLRSSQSMFLRKHKGLLASFLFRFAVALLDRVQPSKRRSQRLRTPTRDVQSGPVSSVVAAPKGRILFVASTGGHLEQLTLLSEFFEHTNNSTWVTFESPQSESLLAGNNVNFVPYIKPRDWKNALRALPIVWRTLRSGKYDAVVSTGAAIALPALLLARLFGKRSLYIESVSRVAGPSLTGRILAFIPASGIELYTQHRNWSNKRWSFRYSLFDRFQRAEPPARLREPRDRLKIFVTLGTIKPYRFDSLVDAVLQLTSDRDVDLVWQLGCTDRNDLPGIVLEQMSADAFNEELLQSDVVISHAGVGTCLRMVAAGIRPILVPRRSVRGEHVDDHQVQIASDLDARGLAEHREVKDLISKNLDLFSWEKA